MSNKIIENKIIEKRKENEIPLKRLKLDKDLFINIFYPFPPFYVVPSYLKVYSSCVQQLFITKKP